SCFLFCFFAETIWGQLNSPAFQTWFYFEDAAGNKDTVLVSGDTITTNEIFNYSAYRGDTVLAPDPSKKFEVYSLPVYDVMLSKLVFTPDVYYEGLNANKLVYYRNVVVDFQDTSFSVEGVFFLFRCKKYPVTVKWDHQFFASLSGYHLMGGSHFLPDHTRFSDQDVFPGEHYTITKFKYLRYDGTWTFHLGDNEDYNRPWQKVFGFFNPQDTLYGLLLNFSPYFNCSEVSKMENDAWESGGVVASVGLTPNPTSDRLRVQMEFASWQEGILSLSDATGRILQENTFGGAGLDIRYEIAQYPAGVYFVLLRTAGESKVFPVIKI
ncbi:MAG: T9SS type A sorting domain-containing protein, partial [Thermoanaerobaculia bacterium]|nr:T9SS type A sorting domain-containing protein [Thermoanaerobaculia bacterium]